MLHVFDHRGRCSHHYVQALHDAKDKNGARLIEDTALKVALRCKQGKIDSLKCEGVEITAREMDRKRAQKTSMPTPFTKNIAPGLSTLGKAKVISAIASDIEPVDLETQKKKLGVTRLRDERSKFEKEKVAREARRIQVEKEKADSINTRKEFRKKWVKDKEKIKTKKFRLELQVKKLETENAILNEELKKEFDTNGRVARTLQTNRI